MVCGAVGDRLGDPAAERVAISNSRLIAIDGDQVLFSYNDYRDGGQWKTAEFHGGGFIGRFLQHMLP